MSSSDHTLVISDVALTRGERALVSGLSFAVGPGQLALVTGPNGSGKTTLLRTIAGLAAPEAGQIHYGGRAIAALEPEERRHVAYQGHFEGLKKDLTVEENLRFISHLRSASDSVSEIMHGVGLGAFRDRAVRHLSAGQKRRAALAGLRLSGARLWLLDEPLTNLDSAGRELVASWIGEHLDAAGTAVIATHLAAGLERPGSLLVEL
jgi:heme exporter protein A